MTTVLRILWAVVVFGLALSGLAWYLLYWSSPAATVRRYERKLRRAKRNRR